MLDSYRKLYAILDARERKITLLLVIVMIVSAVLEAAGAASIMPFVGVLANRTIIQSNPVLSYLYSIFGFESEDSFLVFLGVGFLVLIVGSLAFRALVFWMQVRFSFKRNHTWSSRLVAAYVHQPYEWFLDKHSGNLGSSVLNEVNRLVFQSLFPAIQLIAQLLVAVLLVVLMVAVDPFLAVTVAAVLGGAYVTIFLLVRRLLEHWGVSIHKYDRLRYRIAQEIFGGIKEVKVGGLERAFQARYDAASWPFAQYTTTSKVVSELPSFVMQALVFGGIILILLYFIQTRGDLAATLPAFAFYALAGYRLMPALQAIYRNLTEMRITKATLDHLYPALTSRESIATDSGQHLVPPITVTKNISLEDVSYRYPAAANWTLSAVRMDIPALSTVGLVGTSGAGKTTLVDLILGLLSPAQGYISVDGIPITGERRIDWQHVVGYVPQQIFLTDESVSMNIAFGVPAAEIDQARVEEAARIANLHEFVVKELPDGYATIVGERGVRLSGGQRQRIGIARALYRDPQVLLLDEATSALDNLTEQAVMDAVRSLNKKKTIILIAHRLSTVRECHKIFYVDAGRIVASGTYSELLTTLSAFRELAGADGQQLPPIENGTMRTANGT